MEENKKIKVSDEFIELYRNFNVYEQSNKMKSLNKKDLYLLLTLCLDKHSEEDPVVVNNFLPFREECMKIFDVQDDKGTDDLSLKELIEETGDEYIDTDTIVGSSGSKLPEPYTQQEARDIKIQKLEE